MTTRALAVVGTGWLGGAVVADCAGAGWDVLATYRGAGTREQIIQAGARPVPLDLPEETGAFLAQLPARWPVLMTLPPGGRRLGAAATPRYLALLEALAPALAGRHVIYTSSTGVYGDARGPTDEHCPRAPATDSGRAVAAAEDWLSERCYRLTILRLAGLYGPGRHPGRFYGGRPDRPIPAADAPVNLVHRADAVAAVRAVAERQLTGTYNVCAAAHPPKGDFYAAAAGRLGLAVAGRRPGGAGGKVIRSERLRQRAGWRPRYDDLGGL